MTTKSVVLGLVRTKFTPVLIRLCVYCLPQSMFDPNFGFSNFRGFPRRRSCLVRYIILLHAELKAILKLAASRFSFINVSTTSSRPTAAATSNRHLLALDVQLLPLHNVLHPAPLLHVLLLLLSQLHPQHPPNPRCSQPSCLLLALLVTLYFSMAVNATKSTWIQQHTSGCRQKRWSAFQSPTSANSTRIYYSQPYLFNASSRSETGTARYATARLIGITESEFNTFKLIT